MTYAVACGLCGRPSAVASPVVRSTVSSSSAGTPSGTSAPVVVTSSPGAASSRTIARRSAGCSGSMGR